MNYTKSIKIEFKDDIEILESRLDLWSKKYNFKLVENDDFKWIYKRGNHFRASCSFDVRYVPTTVTINYLESEKAITSSFHVKSFFYHAMPTDNSRVDEQIELFVAYIKGVVLYRNIS